jgi:two-component system KDP operon response regulator KdpE
VSKVMIVEDDATSVKLLKILLEEVDGFEVSVARKGSDVMPLAEQTKPDVFLIDYHLLDMNGIDLIKSLRASTLFAKTPIVMASGLDVEVEALKAGANKFLTKPYEPEDLSRLFNELTAAPASAASAPAAPTTPTPTSTPPAPAGTTTKPTS